MPSPASPNNTPTPLRREMPLFSLSFSSKKDFWLSLSLSLFLSLSLSLSIFLYVSPSFCPSLFLFEGQGGVTALRRLSVVLLTATRRSPGNTALTGTGAQRQSRSRWFRSSPRRWTPPCGGGKATLTSSSSHLSRVSRLFLSFSFFLFFLSILGNLSTVPGGNHLSTPHALCDTLYPVPVHACSSDAGWCLRSDAVANARGSGMPRSARRGS